MEDDNLLGEERISSPLNNVVKKSNNKLIIILLKTSAVSLPHSYCEGNLGKLSGRVPCNNKVRLWEQINP